MLNFNRNLKIRRRQKSSKAIYLTIPFLLLALLLIIVPLIMMIVYSFLPTDSGSMNKNWEIIDDFIWKKILQSIIIAIASTTITISIAYPFAYFLSFGTGKTFRTLVIMLVTAPIWTSFLVKLVGLKSFLDVMFGYPNSTYGDIFTIIGLIYLYLPFMILPLYTTLSDMPRNLVFASHDLGRNGTSTFFNIVIPYSKTALFSGITLVFLPALTTVAVPQFLNNMPNGSMIGDIIVEQGGMALISEISLARAATLSLVLSLLMLAGFVFFLIIKVLYRYKKRKGGY